MLGMKHIANNDGAKIGQHNQQRWHRRSASWLFELLGIRSGKGGCHSPNSVRRHAARRAQYSCKQHITGAIPTGIFGKAFGVEADKADNAAGAVAAAFSKAQPVSSAGSPDGIAEAAAFLASDGSSFINGQDLVVDGGLTGGRRSPAIRASMPGARLWERAQSERWPNDDWVKCACFPWFALLPKPCLAAAWGAKDHPAMAQNIMGFGGAEQSF